jgi:hypothetical protein
MLLLFMYTSITRLASKEIFSPLNKVHWEVGRAKDLSAPRYKKANQKLRLQSPQMKGKISVEETDNTQ